MVSLSFFVNENVIFSIQRDPPINEKKKKKKVM